MLQWINKQGVSSSEGWMLQREHRFFYHYLEGNRVLKIDVELGAKYEEVFFPKTQSWQALNEGEELGDVHLIQVKKMSKRL